MKRFIYLSVLLIIAGSAFGVADYFKEKKNGTFAILYKEDEEETPEPAITVKEPAIAGNEMKPVAVVNRTTAVKAENKAAVKASTAKKLKKKAPRKLSLKMFTRGNEFEKFTPPAIIDEPILGKTLPAEPVKKEQPEVKEIVPVADTELKNDTKKPSLMKMFSRAKPPKRHKKIAMKPTT